MLEVYTENVYISGGNGAGYTQFSQRLYLSWAVS